MDKLTEEVFSFPKLSERIQGRAGEKLKAKKILKEIKADFSPTWIGHVSTFLDLSFRKLYDSINLEVKGDYKFDQLVQDNHVVLVPNHQSHADYIAIGYAIHNRFKIPLYVAGGINLNIFPIGKLFRKCGCFFIRRSFSTDILYKLVLEGYLQYLLRTNQVVEFFFEGGRSRTGKLLPPRYGLYQMLIEVHQTMENPKPLVFVPVSIMHEHVPEQRAHIKEVLGRKKVAESPTQLLKLLKLFSVNMGSIHLVFGKPIESKPQDDLKGYTRDLAFTCFREVGRNMKVTPSSLISLIMLDEYTGAMTWDQIYDRATEVVGHCKRFNLPLVKSLTQGDIANPLKAALNLLITNRKIELFEKPKLGKLLYAIRPECRLEMLYFKNTILHHFLVPFFINQAWLHIFNGSVKNFEDLKRILLRLRKQLKYEFYLPEVKELIQLALKMISDCLGRNIKSLEEGMNLSSEELYKIAKSLSVFSRSCSYIYEAYYISLLTIKHLCNETFSRDKFLKTAKEVFEVEKSHGRLIKYPESFNHPLLISSLRYFENIKVLDRHGLNFLVQDIKRVDQQIDLYSTALTELLSFNIRINK